MSFKDAIQGEINQTLSTDIGDFILKRADGLFAYQLAVVVDDAAQGITHIVRGADLLDSTPRQIYLQKQLNYLQPQYAHIPLASNSSGEKLSKQTLAKPVTDNNTNQLFYEALLFLGQQPPLAIKNATLTEMWRWACSNWQLASIPKLRHIPVTI
jgi:glutamyl-Q tRNA(Asp) synthetase